MAKGDIKNAYQLTDRGRSLAPLLKELVVWGMNNIVGTEARISLNLQA